MLVEKAYPVLQAGAQELVALNHFLTQIENPHLPFRFCQKALTTLDTAVAATLELETYLQSKLITVHASGIQESHFEHSGWVYI